MNPPGRLAAVECGPFDIYKNENGKKILLEPLHRLRDPARMKPLSNKLKLQVLFKPLPHAQVAAMPQGIDDK